MLEAFQRASREITHLPFSISFLLANYSRELADYIIYVVSGWFGAYRMFLDLRNITFHVEIRLTSRAGIKFPVKAVLEFLRYARYFQSTKHQELFSLSHPFLSCFPFPVEVGSTSR